MVLQALFGGQHLWAMQPKLYKWPNFIIILAFDYHSAGWRHGMGTLFTDAWRHHQMETFSALLAICAGNSPVPSEFPAQRPATRSFDVCLDLRLNKRLGKQSWGWWFETLSRWLWRHSNAFCGQPTREAQHKETLYQSLNGFPAVSKNRLLNKQSSGQWN